MRIKRSTATTTFEDLDCWKQCRVLWLFVAKQVVPVLPKDERYRLGDQLLRAGRAATANIAEGYGLFHYLNNAKFCSNACGSCWETLNHLITANDEGFIATELLNQGRMLVNEAVKVLNGYMSYQKRAHRARATRDNA
jgi:four helix bundle protein